MVNKEDVTKSSSGPKTHILGHIWQKKFLLLCVFIIVTPILAKGIWKNVLILKNAGSLIIVEGENPVENNFQDYEPRLPNNRVFFGGQALELDTPVAVEGGYFMRYEFEVPEEGEYKIFLAGTPPGPAAAGSQWHSQYSLSIDGAPFKLLTEEGLQAEWPYIFRYQYAVGGYYFTKLTTERLTAGRHVVTFSVGQPRQYDGHFTIYVDALVIVPIDFKPQTDAGKVPKAVFYE